MFYEKHFNRFLNLTDVLTRLLETRFELTVKVGFQLPWLYKFVTFVRAEFMLSYNRAG